MSSARSTTATGMALIPPAAFALAAVGQRLLARRKRKRCAEHRSGEQRRSGTRAENGPRENTKRCRCAQGGRRGSCCRRVLSLGVGAASAGLLVAAASELADADTTLDARHPAQASTLVTSGVFGSTRNPLYLGLAGLLTAHALWLGSRRALIPAGAFVLAIDQWQIPAEEAALAEKFGKVYRAYTAQVPRWVLR
ncbi:MAG TPA: isoprenylcysteine carboxylmethyltransferase family protein [Candidatus Ruania gallistercoris]|uniref:Isoprenylcysteine carboxylmethyltransferase family protein n=1 Tax=Candidatus Ruania gallistercoris TaxID=2838746 RepID=A0A9D2J6S1_9MICO|nr:isoprenylcysteine carboxylmethyltransferase family protein [Candidatus Ruania gallistercoris]